MKKTLLATTAFVLMASAVVLYGQSATGSARLHPIDQSGIYATINFLDHFVAPGNPQNRLVVSGHATGLTPGQTYISLIYENGSLAGGPEACEPVPGAPFINMFIGFWTVAADGTGTLFAVKATPAVDGLPGGYTSMTAFQTISIRNASMGGALQACGEVSRQP